MENEEIKGNVTRQDIWKRAVYMLVFVVAYSVAEFILGAIVLFQFLMVLITKETNEALKDFSVQLCQYIYQIVRYLSFNTEYRPYPFNPWPKIPSDSESSDSSASHSDEADNDRIDDAISGENAGVSDPTEATNDIDVGTSASDDAKASEVAMTSGGGNGDEEVVVGKESAEDETTNKPGHT